MTREEKEAMLHRYEGYFAKLRDYLVVVVQLKAICDNTEYTLSCLNSIYEDIEATLQENEIPGYTNFDIREISNDGDYNARLKQKNEQCCASISHVINDVDSKLTEVSKVIASLTANPLD